MLSSFDFVFYTIRPGQGWTGWGGGGWGGGGGRVAGVEELQVRTARWAEQKIMVFSVIGR